MTNDDGMSGTENGKTDMRVVEKAKKAKTQGKWKYRD